MTAPIKGLLWPLELFVKIWFAALYLEAGGSTALFSVKARADRFSI